MTVKNVSLFGKFVFKSTLFTMQILRYDCLLNFMIIISLKFQIIRCCGTANYALKAVLSGGF